MRKWVKDEACYINRIHMKQTTVGSSKKTYSVKKLMNIGRLVLCCIYNIARQMDRQTGRQSIVPY